MFVNTKFRNREEELMDDFSMEGNELTTALQTIVFINQKLGGNKITINGVKELLKSVNKSKPITIYDVGCGNGDMLREIAKFGLLNGYQFDLIGIDANAFTIKEAINLSEEFTNISYIQENILHKQINEVKIDITLFTLTLHHFSDDEINMILQDYLVKSKLGIVINDLHRSSIAYHLFQLVCFVFQLKEMPKKDGLLSILKGFKKEELIAFSKKINASKQIIQWKWAFRYQWIIWK
ncbi:methyltransferase domain-containing protein [Flavobacterium azooxidireducens]|uniref:Methyltransferase domain-containing protein n=1 Tax=Flavobacterium azooxidireducens TaxID=1871076 RepID=A0ABY4KDD5_9FLAO|nr:methyltransferase domain-containing protein [Flavobacterium azooxidireducens]UPQ78811.1 methyltransferase domain-containing protein [Flavobacterium azooxidireducens]